MWKTSGAPCLSTGFPHTYPPVFHIPLTTRRWPAQGRQSAESGFLTASARAGPRSGPGGILFHGIARKEHTTTASEIAIVIAAGANAAGVILGLGQLKQALTDIRDDIRALRTENQSFLQTLLVCIKGNPPNSTK